jgi:hypothetical protein
MSENTTEDSTKFYNTTVRIGELDIKTLQGIFANESDFKPQSREDRLLIEIMRQVLNNEKILIV